MSVIKKWFSAVLPAIKRAGKCTGRKIKSFFLDRNPAAWFVGLLSLSSLAFLVYAIAGGYEAFMSLFFRGGKDMFMDYFNSVRDVSLGEGVYTVRHVIYPPMANLLLLVFLQFVPKEYAATAFVDRQTWVNYPAATFSVLLFLLIPMILLALLCATNLKRATAPQKAFGLFSIINYPVLYMIERGNILIYTVLATAVFVFYYNSESKVKRELALLSLAFAFSLKIYPAILGAVLITDKRYKDAIRCAIYAVLLLLIPSFFFGGPACLLTMVKYIGVFSDKRGSSVGSVIFWISFAVFLVAVFTQKDKTKLLIFGVAVLRVFPALASMYAWAFFLPVLCLIMNEREKLNREDIAYFLLMAIPFNLIPGITKDSYADFASGLLYALLALCIAETAFVTWRAVKQRRAAYVGAGAQPQGAFAVETAAGETEGAPIKEPAATSERETETLTNEAQTEAVTSEPQDENTKGES